MTDPKADLMKDKETAMERQTRQRQRGTDRQTDRRRQRQTDRQTRSDLETNKAKRRDRPCET